MPSEVLVHAHLPASVASKSAEVSTTQFFALWHSVLELSGDQAVGIRLASQLEPAVMPPAFIAGFHASTYRDALNRVARFKRLCAPEQMNILEAGATCSIDLEWIDSREPPPAALVDASMAALLELGRRGTRLTLTPVCVELARKRGTNTHVHEAYYGCRVRVAAKHNRLVLARADLDRPFASYNEELLELIDSELTRVLDEQQPPSINDKVFWILKRRMSAGQLDLQAVAAELGMSGRTLQRRITAAGSSFQNLVTSARQTLARDYLADPSLELKEVASLLGYEDQNSFFRAFRQWEGETPAIWREAHHPAKKPSTTSP